MKNVKRILCLCLIGLMCQNMAFAQKKLNYVDILSTIKDMEVFVENRKFKKQVMAETKLAAEKPMLSHKEYSQLQTAYNDLAAFYNDQYLEAIKADMSNVNTIKRMIKKPDLYARKYASLFEGVVFSYNDDFQPMMLSLSGVSNQGDVSSLLGIGIDIFKAVINMFQNRKEGREAQLQVAVSLANKYLFKELRMKSWNELNIEVPEPSIVGIKGKVDEEKKEYKEPIPVTPAAYSSIQPIIANGPALKNSVSGSIKFMQKDLNGASLPMEFRKTDGPAATIDPNIGDIDVGELPTSGIQSVKAYPTNTYCKFEATGDGLLYIFSVNSGNRMFSLYPQIGKTNEINEEVGFSLPDFDPSLNLDIDVGEIPSSETVVQIPKRQYMRIRDKAGQEPPFAEKFVILLSRKEINLKAVMQKMETMSPDISVENRLAEIFGESGDAAKNKVYVEGNIVRYLFDANDPEVVPVTFSILRK